MYKLENNVQWTDELKNAFKHGTTRASISYIDDNNEEVEINENNGIIELTLEEPRYIDKLGFVGSACARKLEITIQDANNSWNLENQYLTLRIGADYNGSTYYINYGRFIVDEAPQIDETNGRIKVVAYDYMIKFNQPYEDTITYPTTLLNLLQDICDKVVIDLGNTDFPNADFIVTDNQFAGATMREVIQNIAKCAFSWARIGQDNKLYLDFNVTPEYTETLTIDDYKTNGFKKSQKPYKQVNEVVYADSNIEGQEVKISDDESIAEYGLNQLVIYDNLFAYTPEKAEELIQEGDSLFGLTYMPVSQLEAIGFIYLDCNDIINIETLDNQTYTTRVFNHTIKYNGAISDNITTEAQSLNEQIYKNTANSTLQNQQTKIIVDKANKQINSIVQEIGDRSTKTTTITQDLDGISSEVSELKDFARQASGRGQIFLEETSDVAGTITLLRITGETNLLHLSPTTYLSNNLYLYGQYLTLIIDSQPRGHLTNDHKELQIPMPFALNVLDEDIFDELKIENGELYIIKRVGIDGSGNKYELVNPIITIVENVIIPSIANSMYLYVLENPNLNYYSEYLTDSDYAKYFPSKAELKSSIIQTEESIMSTVSETYETKENAETNYSQINQTAHEISLEVGRKVGNDEIISKINQSPEAVSINASKININGTISANGNFKVDTDGNMECNSGNFIGGKVTLESTNTQTGNLRIIGSGVETSLTGHEIYIKSDYAGIYLNPNSSSYIPAYLYISGGEGQLFLGGNDTTRVKASGITTPVVTQTSKANSKKNFEKLENALNILKDIDIYKYNLKNEEDGTKKRIGFVIGDNFKYSEELTTPDNEGVDAYSVASACLQAIKEQQEEIEALQKEIKSLKGE